MALAGVNGSVVVLVREEEQEDLQKPLLAGDYYASSDDKLGINEDAGGTSFPRTVLNACNAISGMGVLSMPYALSLAGWLSLGIFVAVAGICYYTGLLIQRCMAADAAAKTLPGIGEHAFGRRGKVAISVFMYLELYLVAAGFLIMEGDNLEKLFPGVGVEFAGVRIEGKQLFILLSASVILPTTWLQNLGILAYVSAGGVAASTVLLGALLWAGVAETGFRAEGTMLFDVRGLPTALGLFFMCFTCHAVFPTISSSMADGTKFSKVLSISFVLCTLNYGVMAVLGYLMYGGELRSQVTLNLPAGKIYTRVAIYTTLINPLTKYALATTPISRAIEQQLGVAGGGSASLLIRTLLLCGTVAIAVAVPFFGYLMSLVGSLLCVVVSVLFPCVCYVKIQGVAGVGRLEMAGITGIVVVGCVVAVVGTYSSLREIFFSG